MLGKLYFTRHQLPTDEYQQLRYLVLHQFAFRSITVFSYIPFSLPTKNENFVSVNWRFSCLNVTKTEMYHLGLGCSTVIHPEAAAICAAQILALNDDVVWARLRVHRCQIWIDLKRNEDTLI